MWFPGGWVHCDREAWQQAPVVDSEKFTSQPQAWSSEIILEMEWGHILSQPLETWLTTSRLHLLKLPKHELGNQGFEHTSLWGTLFFIWISRNQIDLLQVEYCYNYMSKFVTKSLYSSLIICFSPVALLRWNILCYSMWMYHLIGSNSGLAAWLYVMVSVVILTESKVC